MLTALNRLIAYAEGSCCHEASMRAGWKFGPLVHSRMEAGRYITAGQYLAAQRLRSQVCADISRVWAIADIIAMPCAPCPPPILGSRTVSLQGCEESAGTALVKFTAPFSLTGSPAMTLPCGWDSEDMPVGLQLAAPPHEDELMCFVAASYEARRDGSIALRRPPLTI